jgi:cleavage and polyadenylation specificity factor subunit 1
MTLLPRTKAPRTLPATAESIETAADDTIPENEILITSCTGTISLLSPLSEAQYRRLTTVTNMLANTLYHACGLNPKAYRITVLAPEPVIGGRPIVDGTVMMRWMELGSQRRAEVAGRVGVDVMQVREDLESLVGGLAYL